MTRVVILYNEPTLPADHPDAIAEHEIVYTVGDIAKVLESEGYDVRKLGAHVNPGRMIADLKKLKPDVVFNLFEGLPEMGQTEAYAAGILDWMGIPYTGCPFQCLVLARNKPLTKRLLRDARLPTPNFLLIDSMPPPQCKLGWPVIVKPSNQDASVGVDQASVVTSQKQFEARVEFIYEEYGPPVLAEQFIDGREFNVGMIEAPELTPLPPWEVRFTPGGSSPWRVHTYDAKWKPGSHDYDTLGQEYQPEIDPKLSRKMKRLAIRAFHLLGCRDIARVDFRVSTDNKPYILEMNPNPDVHPEGGIAPALELIGIPHDRFLVQLVENAKARATMKLEEPVNVQVMPW